MPVFGAFDSSDPVAGTPMSFIATFISLVVIIGAALVVLTAVVGYGCYSLFREFSAKPPRQLDA